ncbi:PLP-dependent aminotransferase family protein [Paralimibaculum aggregatum]|uniref:PLP-dependent aminotransferase family protein n=1 Tax=Paralimibaculum aggregatum TaxID=3036245 RepID=A0ABQ6LQC9_9RHOB|nr:PLP-dependent aminotransferase family protein [Limibaculum sp. NKW23]GMG83698.1 PLP-dependent aminotransferase family protein [Limibaculum sp. NKW23]
MRDALYHLDRSLPATLQAQIREILVSAIGAGQLRPAEPVPSTRAMAHRLGVSRNTVTLAYQALVSEGFLQARERSGFYVDPAAIEGLNTVPQAPGSDTPATGAIDWAARTRMQMEDLRFLRRPTDWSRYRFPFIYGQVDHTVFPIAEWRDSMRQAMGKRWLDAWTVDQYAHDDPLLLDEIVRRILPRRGIQAGPDQVLVTLGAQNALYLVAEYLSERGTAAAMEDPGYPDLRNMLRCRGVDLRAVPVDDEGLVVDERLDPASLIFVTPSHHYPSTVTMSLERRQALLAAAAERDAVIVEDDYEFETNYMGSPLPALKSLDREGRVVYVGSFSKSVMPGLRLGFIVAERALVTRLRDLRRLMLRHPPGNNQRAAALFMTNGHYEVLVRRIHRVYRGRWLAMQEALETHLPGWAQAPGFGGSAFWLTGPAGFDSAGFAERALAEGVLVEPGGAFFAREAAGARHLRLGFSSIPAERIPEGIGRIARLWGGLAAAG